jgi:hypothetical protein
MHVKSAKKPYYQLELSREESERLCRPMGPFAKLCLADPLAMDAVFFLYWADDSSTVEIRIHSTALPAFLGLAPEHDVDDAFLLCLHSIPTDVNLQTAPG